jgi:hypothetical protein
VKYKESICFPPPDTTSAQQMPRPLPNISDANNCPNL